MASVPNMNVFHTMPPAGAAAAVEGEGGEIFANLLPAVTAGSVLTGSTMPAAPVTILTQETAKPTRAGLPGGETVEGGAEGDDAETADPEAAEGNDEAIAALFAQAQFVPVVQTPAPVPPVAVTTPVPSAPPPDTGRIVPEAAARLSETRPAPVRLTGVPLTLPVPVGDEAAETPATPNAAGDGSAPQRPVDMPTKPAARGEALPDELVIPVKAIVKQVAAAQAVTPAAETAQKAPTLPILPVVDGGDTPRRAPRAVAEKAAAPVAPAPMTSVAAPLVALSDPVAAAPSAPAQRSDARPTQPAEQAIQHELDLAHESEWLDRLARDIAGAGASDGPMRFKLHPQTLGHLKVELTQGDNGTSVRLTVETEAARAILADAQPKLVAEARAQGVRIAQTDIDLSGSGQQASGDPRRHEDARQTTIIRTARGAGGETKIAVETARARSDRYA